MRTWDVAEPMIGSVPITAGYHDRSPHMPLQAFPNWLVRRAGRLPGRSRPPHEGGREGGGGGGGGGRGLDARPADTYAIEVQPGAAWATSAPAPGEAVAAASSPTSQTPPLFAPSSTTFTSPPQPGPSLPRETLLRHASPTFAPEAGSPSSRCPLYPWPHDPGMGMPSPAQGTPSSPSAFLSPRPVTAPAQAPSPPRPSPLLRQALCAPSARKARPAGAIDAPTHIGVQTTNHDMLRRSGLSRHLQGKSYLSIYMGSSSSSSGVVQHSCAS